MAEKAYKCPKCGSDMISLQTLAWADFENGKFYAFEPGESPEVPDGARGVCHKCGHEWAESQVQRS